LSNADYVVLSGKAAVPEDGVIIIMDVFLVGHPFSSFLAHCLAHWRSVDNPFFGFILWHA
jgi:1-acyl-sn-glycerol-3-phosphate acyltransferase